MPFSFQLIPTLKTGLALVLFFCCCMAHAQDGIYYVSLNRSVRLGNYDGVRTLAEAKKHGNYGLGSIDKIAAELVLVNDTAYQISADGNVKIMDPQTILPFAAVKFFSPEKQYSLNKPYSLKGLHTLLDSLLGNKNAFAAVRITGQFTGLNYFCYQPQQKPYKDISKAEKKMTKANNITGTIVGFYTPEAAGVINSPVYHFHFINAARNSGGHVEELLIKNVVIEIDYADELKIALPYPSLKMDVDLK